MNELGPFLKILYKIYAARNTYVLYKSNVLVNLLKDVILVNLLTDVIFYAYLFTSKWGYI